ncbi:MAG: hypothetical protein KatS3mg100_496 [Candidatus Parcubacteria bacterium]|nr:MAG: hypothetical protein KatS3mg100_496 [Candidatus Parcubacteria bacterium]
MGHRRKTYRRWTKGMLHQMILRFFQENGRFPNTYDFDECEFLPSARQIQRRFGGITELGKNINLPLHDERKGKRRSQKVSAFWRRAKDWERKTSEELVQIFGEIAVHEEKQLVLDGVRGLRTFRVDFMVYTPWGEKWGIDIFFPTHIKSFEGIVRHKIKKYHLLTHNFPQVRWFFVCVNPSSSAENLRYIQTKIQHLLPSECIVTNYECFITTARKLVGNFRKNKKI